MYNFIDTIEVSEGMILPSEALQINGEYIENIISGYRTLGVSGREALSPELETYETGARDGSTIKNKRYPARTIIVKYQLIAKSNEAFRDAYNELGHVLNVEDAELIFADEQDKFFIGTPSLIGDVEPGRNAVVGEIELFCADPFKYSVTEYEAQPTNDDGMAFLITYNGTHKGYPKLEASFYTEDETSEDGEADVALTGNGDCGFVAFFNDREKIIQLGDPDEEDAESYPKSQTLTTQSFSKSTSWSLAIQNRWVMNSGRTSSDTYVQTGTLGLVKPAPAADPTGYYLAPTNYGSGTKFHGPSITRTVPADKAGDLGASNFKLTYKQKMSIGNGKNDTKQRGSFQVLLLDADDKIVCGLTIYKASDGSKAKLRFYVNGKTKSTQDIYLTYHNKAFGNNQYKTVKGKSVLVKKTVKTSTIQKSGSKIIFNAGGFKKTFTDSAIKDTAVTKIVFSMMQYGTKPALAFNGIYNAKFIKNNCDTWRDVPNKFSANDVVVADCKTGEILLNDTATPELGALGNDWEEFYLENGLNQIGVTYSDWVADDYAPSFKVRYREVFL